MMRQYCLLSPMSVSTIIRLFRNILILLLLFLMGGKAIAGCWFNKGTEQHFIAEFGEVKVFPTTEYNGELAKISAPFEAMEVECEPRFSGWVTKWLWPYNIEKNDKVIMIAKTNIPGVYIKISSNGDPMPVNGKIPVSSYIVELSRGTVYFVQLIRGKEKIGEGALTSAKILYYYTEHTDYPEGFTLYTLSLANTKIIPTGCILGQKDIQVKLDPVKTSDFNVSHSVNPKKFNTALRCNGKPNVTLTLNANNPININEGILNLENAGKEGGC